VGGRGRAPPPPPPPPPGAHPRHPQPPPPPPPPGPPPGGGAWAFGGFGGGGGVGGGGGRAPPPPPPPHRVADRGRALRPGRRGRLEPHHDATAGRVGHARGAVGGAGSGRRRVVPASAGAHTPLPLGTPLATRQRCRPKRWAREGAGGGRGARHPGARARRARRIPARAPESARRSGARLDATTDLSVATAGGPAAPAPAPRAGRPAQRAFRARPPAARARLGRRRPARRPGRVHSLVWEWRAAGWRVARRGRAPQSRPPTLECPPPSSPG